MDRPVTPPSDEHTAAAAAAAAWPPAGWVWRDGACRMFGVTLDTWKGFTRSGRVACGRWFAKPGGGRCMLYPVAELERLVGELGVGRPFPPPGYVDADGAARILGIEPTTLWLYKKQGRIRCGELVRGPAGKACKIYPVAELERDKRDWAASRPTVPEGFVEVDEVCRMFGITKAAWVIWQRSGRAPRGEWGRSRTNKPCRIYAVEELLRLKEEVHGADKVYMEPGDSRQYHIPAGWVRMQDACRMFGVHRNTWERWEQEGLITCGKRATARRLKLYPVEELDRLLAECGRYEPPYPDPQRPGVYRVPLAGQDINRREALIDAADLPLVEGKRFHWSGREPYHHAQVATFTRDGGPSRLHQIVMGVVGGADERVAHLNDDPLDCRRANLVVRSLSESGAAARKATAFRGRPCTSRFKGVCWSESRGKWKAYVKKGGVMRNLGSFEDEISAAEARDEAARELFGEHDRLNFPDGIDAAGPAVPARAA